MRALPLLLLLYVNYVVCVEEWKPRKPYPKKVIPEVNRNLHLRRFIVNNAPEKITKKKSAIEEYTAFPLTGDQGYGIPNSPYFPLEENVHKKDSFIPSLRKKRSPKAKAKAKPKAKKKAKPKKAKPKRAGRAKAKRTVKKKAKKAVKKAKPKPKKRTAKKPAKKPKKAKKTKKVKSLRRLIAAKDALIEEYPYTVSIQKGKDHWCSGALLNQRMVITTANCVWNPRYDGCSIDAAPQSHHCNVADLRGSRMSRLKIRAGTRHVDRGGQVAKIQEVMRHPRWNIRSYPDNDVALLLLDRKIRFSHSVHGVDLPNRIMLPPFNDVWVTGYGANRRDGLYPDTDMTLQVYHSQLLDREKCNNITMRFGVAVTENFICLAQAGRRAPCTRDTGAPAVSDGVVWGLASWGIRKLCGTERFPAVYSYLASQSNMDFIANATKSLMSEQRFYPFLDRYPKKPYNYSYQTTTDQYYTGQH